MNCPKCSGKLFHNQGVSKKTNRSYENYKCSKCSFIEWVNQKEPDESRLKSKGLVTLNENLKKIAEEQRQKEEKERRGRTKKSKTK